MKTTGTNSCTPDSAEAVNVRLLINRRIAELCGWIIKDNNIGWTWTDPKGNRDTELPNYSTSLDAMHEAEKTLTELEWPKYVTTLNALIGFTHDNEVWTCHATAAQRAAAFLTTKTRTNS